MPDAARAVSGIPRAHPGGRVTPRFWHRLNRFRHFCGGSLALASLDRACRNLVPAVPQRSPPRLLTAAACGGLRSAPDCRTRRALLHLSYSCAPPILRTALVTHDPTRSLVGPKSRSAASPDLILTKAACWRGVPAGVTSLRRDMVRLHLAECSRITEAGRRLVPLAGRQHLTRRPAGAPAR